MIRSKVATLLLGGMLLVIGSCAKNTQNGSVSEKAGGSSGSREINLTIPDSTQIVVTLSDTVQTNRNHAGDHFEGVAARSVDVDGKTVIPEGARVTLVITKLVKGGRLKTPPEIAFTVSDITLPDGKSYPVTTNQAYERGRSHTKREVGMIGGGAAAGAIVGGLMGKGKGAAIGAVAGAAAGTGAAAATGRQNLMYVPGQTVTFTVKEPVNVAVSQK